MSSTEGIEIGCWKYAGYTIQLINSNLSIKGIARKKDQKYEFTANEVSFGISSEIKGRELLEKVGKIGQEAFSAVLFPKEEPKEIWFFDLPKSAAIVAARAKSLAYRNPEGSLDYKKILSLYETALKMAKKNFPEKEHLELAEEVQFFQKKELVDEWEKVGKSCLYDESEKQKFLEQVTFYKEGSNDLSDISEYISKNGKDSHVLLLKALLHEKGGEHELAVQEYIKLSMLSRSDLSCLQRAYKILSNFRSETKNNVEVVYKKKLTDLRNHSVEKKPKCCIFFPLDEAVEKWVYTDFLTDLRQAGIVPIVQNRCEKIFLESLMENVDLILLIMDKGSKFSTLLKKVEKNKEINLKKIFSIFLKGKKRNTCDYQNIANNYFLEKGELSYYFKALDLFFNIKNTAVEAQNELRAGFIEEVTEVFNGRVDQENLSEWSRIIKGREKLLRLEANQVAGKIYDQQIIEKNSAEIDKLKNLCKTNQRVAVVGGAGVGKTTLLELFLLQEEEQYSQVQWINGTKKEFVEVALLDLADKLGVSKFKSVDERLKGLKGVLEKSKNFLFIIDGVKSGGVLDKVHEWIPDSSGQIIITARDPILSSTKGYVNFEVLLMREMEAVEYLRDEMQSQNIEDLQKISKILCFHPHSLSFAKICIKEFHITAARYLAILRTEIGKLDGSKLEREEKAISASCVVAVRAIIRHKGRVAKELIQIFCTLSSAQISSSFIKTWGELFCEDEGYDQINSALQLLMQGSIVKKGHHENYRAVSSFLKTERLLISDSERKDKRLELQKTFIAFLNSVKDEEKKESVFSDYFPHIEKLFSNPYEIFRPEKIESCQLEQTAKFFISLIDFILAKNLHKNIKHLVEEFEHFLQIYPNELKLVKAQALLSIGDLHERLCNFFEAKFSFQEALDIQVTELGENSTDLMKTFRKLGNVTGELGAYQEAYQYERSAITILENIGDTSSVEYAKCLNNLGNTLHDLGRYEEALRVKKRALHIFKELREENSVSIAAIFNNIGLTYIELGDYSEAVSQLKKSLEIRESFPETYYSTGQSHNNLGTAYFELGDYNLADYHQKKALEIALEKDGEDHPDVGTIYADLAAILCEKGDTEKALDYQNRALEIFEKHYGKAHPEIAKLLRYRGVTFRDLGLLTKAKEDHERSLEMVIQLLGEEHPDTPLGYNELGNTLGELGDFQEALEYQQKGYRLNKEILGKNHPDLACSLESIGMSFHQIGFYQEALAYLKNALKIRLDSFGDDHPELAFIYNDLGIVYGELNKYSEAIEFQNKALNLRKKYLGEKHPLTISCMNDLGIAYSEEQEYSEGLKYQYEALRLARKNLPKNSPIIGRCENSIGVNLGYLGSFNEAVPHFDRALEIFSQNFDKKHPDFSLCLNNIGVNFGELGECSKALDYLERALESRLEHFGEFHPLLGQSYNNLGACLGDLSRHKEAIECFVKALEITKDQSYIDLELTVENLEKNRTALGVLDAVLNRQVIIEMADAYKILGDYEHSLNYYLEFLEIQDRECTEEEEIAVTKQKISEVLSIMGRIEEAKKYSDEAKKIFDQFMSEEDSESDLEYNFSEQILDEEDLLASSTDSNLSSTSFDTIIKDKRKSYSIESLPQRRSSPF